MINQMSGTVWTVSVRVAAGNPPVIEYLTEGLEQGYRPYHTLFFRPGDTIVWKCEYPLAVQFGWNTPLERDSYTNPKAGELTVVVPAGVRNGQYKYTVAVWYDNRIITGDPDIVAKPGG